MSSYASVELLRPRVKPLRLTVIGPLGADAVVDRALEYVRARVLDNPMDALIPRTYPHNPNVVYIGPLDNEDLYRITLY